MSINKRLVLFSLLLLISFALSSNFIGNPPSILLFEYTNAQTPMNSTATGSQNQATEEVFIVQNTSMSVPATVTHHGQPLHQIVWALPLREDGKIWSGSVSFTASKPIEVEIIHDYKPQQPIDEKHGEPYNFIAPGNRSIAITTLKDIVDVPIEINGTGLSTGSFEFAGSALVFHKASGEPFTVTYTVDAVAKDVTR
ncbi:MAG: hypothetical protein QOK54_09160 [Nitrososphaeraceae archaeon]|nr:hypothetical protein [Nitrososphaeraceae archaeon]MDW0267463.1 hypothetical protein [Nitrososphaeraceae archaeon]MDW0294564.1 hypothetical protein [Nitrososphaeraceae archaeon]